MAWSPDGSLLLLWSDGLTILHSGGRANEVVSGSDTGQGALSSDGERFVYEQQGELFVMDSTGGFPRRIVRTAKPNPCGQPGYCDSSHDPTWSPDGSWIAFVDMTIVPREFHPRALENVYRTTISAVRPNGTGRRILIDLGRSDRRPVAWSTWDLAWSPDGSRFVFSSEAGIHVIDADGSDLRRLAVKGESPTWSPDGTRIAFIRGLQLRIVDDARIQLVARRFLARGDGSSITWVPA